MGGYSTSRSELEKYYKDNSHIRSSTRAEQVFSSHRMYDLFDPSKMKLPREACDSVASPHSRGIILAEDVTGSMGRFLLDLIQHRFPDLITSIYENVSYNPHIMFMGVGDVDAGDSAPLQVTQFETDLRILEQLQKIYLEGGGGSNPFESYILPWYFAGKFTKMDCWDKRGEKGFLFTFGDEEPTPHLTSYDISTIFGNKDSLKTRMITASDCLEMASEKFYCYHIILHGNYYGRYPNTVIHKWRNLMGSHVCDLSNHRYLPELVTTILKMYEGFSKKDAISAIKSSDARAVVRDALKWHEETVEVSNSNVNGSDTPIEVF